MMSAPSFFFIFFSLASSSHHNTNTTTTNTMTFYTFHLDQTEKLLEVDGGFFSKIRENVCTLFNIPPRFLLKDRKGNVVTTVKDLNPSDPHIFVETCSVYSPESIQSFFMNSESFASDSFPQATLQQMMSQLMQLDYLEMRSSLLTQFSLEQIDRTHSLFESAEDSISLTLEVLSHTSALYQSAKKEEDGKRCSAPFFEMMVKHGFDTSQIENRVGSLFKDFAQASFWRLMRMANYDIDLLHNIQMQVNESFGPRPVEFREEALGRLLAFISTYQGLLETLDRPFRSFFVFVDKKLSDRDIADLISLVNSDHFIRYHMERLFPEDVPDFNARLSKLQLFNDNGNENKNEILLQNDFNLSKTISVLFFSM